jgi:hypothetical protein
MPFAAGSAGIAVLLFGYHAFTWRSFNNNIDFCPRLFCDFVDYYYPMGEAIFRTGLPVPGFLYSPFNAILLAVLPPLGLTASLVLWGGLQVLFVILYLLLFRRLVPAGLRLQLLFVALALSSFPLLLNFVGGSVSVFTIVALLGLLVVNEGGHRAAVTVFLLLLSIVFSNIVFFNLLGDFVRYGFYGFIFWANLLLLIALYVELLPPALRWFREKDAQCGRHGSTNHSGVAGHVGS